MSERNPSGNLPLWASRERPEPTGRRTAATRAIAHAAPRAPTQKARILAAIKSARHDGRTRPELARETGISINAVCGRCGDLLHEGVIVEPLTLGRESPKRIRCGAHVLCAIEYVPVHLRPPKEAA